MSDDVLTQQPHQIAGRAASLGQERLDRGAVEILVTAIMGGGEVSLGALAAMSVVGSALTAWPGLPLYPALALGGLVFPIGFMFVIIGRSELFTENFLIPVVSVLNRERSLASLIELWAVSWVGNLLGCIVTACLLLVPGAIGEPLHLGYGAYTAYKLEMAPLSVFVSAILAGGVMTALTWVLLSMRDSVGRVLAITAGGYVLFAANLSHSIVSASIMLVGVFSTQHAPAELVPWLALATVGNIVGGVALVTLLRVAQARQSSD